jgi:murein DD-endopeptidase MepM/ murein hydrolase activator NlpD
MPLTPTRQPSATPTSEPTVTLTALPTPTESAPPAPLLFSYPIGTPGKPFGDGFFIRHGAEVENTWYNPGYLHTGEDWYAIDGDTAGSQVYAIADGEVVYAGANYPGRVVIVRHADDLFSMYGHLDPNLAVRVGQQLARGALVGTVLPRGDATPNHLHFEVRSFLTTSEVNGAAPRYRFRCGQNCPPGPGYWPIDAPDRPSDLGWRNPTHAINWRMLSEGATGEVVVASKPASDTLTLWSSPPGDAAQAPLGELQLRPGERFTLMSIYAGPDATRETSALAYQLWYQVELPDGRRGWVHAAMPSSFETGSDGRPSSVYFNFFPA